MGVARKQGYVDGSFVGSGPVLTVQDPATGGVAGEVATTTLAETEAAIGAARRAFDEGPWPTLAPGERLAVLRELAAQLDRRRDELVEIIVAETGCPRAATEFGQVDLPLRQAHDLAELAATLPVWEHNELPLEEHLQPAGKLRLTIRRYEPVGVVAAISASNFPLVTSIFKIVPALAVGCTVVLRPSPLTPLAVLTLAEAAAAAGIPPGVLNIVVEEGNDGGVLLTTHPDVDLVSFTGSSAVGTTIAAQAAPTLKRLVLELGGKSVQLYLPDAVADGPARPVAGAMAMLGFHAGQACVAQTRMLVPRSAEQATHAAVVEAARQLVVGDPRAAATQVGPLITEAAQQRCLRYIEESVAAGGRLLTGGRVPPSPAEGWYVEPTVIAIDDNANPAARDEIFGPVLTIQAYDDVEEAVRIANDSDYGLSGAVYTDDLDAGLAVANRIRAGNVHVNTGCASAFTPSGGMKRSGLGRERGVPGIRSFQEVKHVVVGSA